MPRFEHEQRRREREPSGPPNAAQAGVGVGEPREGRRSRALTFTLPPESGPNSAILLNILSHGRSRRRQEKRPGSAGSPLPSEAPLLPLGPRDGFLAKRGQVTGVLGAEQLPTPGRRKDGRPFNRAELRSGRRSNGRAVRRRSELAPARPRDPLPLALSPCTPRTRLAAAITTGKVPSQSSRASLETGNTQ